MKQIIHKQGEKKTNTSKAEAFAIHLMEQFTPFPSNEDEREVVIFPDGPC